MIVSEKTDHHVLDIAYKLNEGKIDIDHKAILVCTL